MFMTQGRTPLRPPRKRMRMIYNMVQQQAAMLSFNEVFWALGVAFLAVIPLMFLMKKTGPVKGAVAIEPALRCD